MTTKTLNTLTTNDIRSVYSGKDGKCCCGCAGKHYYNPLHKEEGTKHRGYEVTDENCSARMVKRVLNILQRDAERAEYEETHVAVVVGERVYIAYMRNGVSCAKPAV